jgi:hypothetical protein
MELGALPGRGSKGTLHRERKLGSNFPWRGNKKGHTSVKRKLGAHFPGRGSLWNIIQGEEVRGHTSQGEAVRGTLAKERE